MQNDRVIAAIRAHHDELAEDLDTRVTRVIDGARLGVVAQAQQELVRWCNAELLPHARAEEPTIYQAGQALVPTALLVRAMLAEHRSIQSAIAALTTATDPLEIVQAAITVRAVFRVHLTKENDLLLPALDEAGLDLAPLLDGMHDLVGEGASHPA